MIESLPNDETGNAIREIINNGVNLNAKMKIDFFVVVPSFEEANLLKDDPSLIDFEIEVDYDEDDDILTCYCTKTMFLEYKSIVEYEKKLTNIAKKYNGYFDGFGTYGNL